KRVLELTEGAGVPYALDAVGGMTGLAAVRALGSAGRLLVYGTLSGEPIPLDPRLLIGGQKCIEGFWLSEWAREQGMFTMLKLFRRIVALLRAGVLTTQVEASYLLDDIAQAVQKAETPGRHGKVRLRIG